MGYWLRAEDSVLPVTVPFILQKYAPDPQDLCRFTRDSLSAILESFEHVENFPSAMLR